MTRYTGADRFPTERFPDMTAAKTLLELAGADLGLPRLRDACLVLIDLQYEYLAGPIALPDARRAIANAARLLARARAAGTSIFHIAHKGRPGSLFDRAAERGAIVTELAPLPGEPVIEKSLPNAFAGTDLQVRLAAAGRKEIIVAANSCATRDLPDGRGGSIPAATIHEVALVELSDRFAIIARGDDALV
jgi:hypothetical protein